MVESDPPPPLDVTARLRALGLIPAEQLRKIDHPELYEALRVTGKGPEGPDDGAGRGKLSTLQEIRLEFFAWLDTHHRLG